MVKNTINFDTENSLPILKFQYNTASTDLEENIFKTFVDLALAENKKVVVEATVNQDGTTDVVMSIANVA